MNKESHYILDNAFNEAIKNIKTINNLTNENLLILYSFYKQAIIGNCNTNKPSFIDLKNSTKWTYWNNLKGMSKITAKINYIKLVKTLI